MAKIIMKLSPKLNKQTGKAEILFRFIGGYRVELRTKSGIFINPKMWSEEKKGLKTATFGAEEAKIKKSLNALCDTILDTYTNTPKEEVSKEWINEVIDRFHFPEKYVIKEEVQKQTFFELFDEFLEARKLSVVREKNFRVLYRTLQRYEIYKDQPLDIDTATDETIRDIYKFIENEHTLCDTAKYKRILKLIPEARTPQPRGHNTMSATFTKLRTFWGWCITAKKTTNHPIIEVKEEIYGTPYYITIDERKQIECANLSAHPHLEVQRDIFVFQCCIGCRVGDLYKITRGNVVDGAIHYVPRKTKDGNPVTVSVPLNSVAHTILDRYEDEEREKLLPFISEQKYNDAIKRIFELSGIDRIVQVRNTLTGESEPKPISEVASSHLARRTFVGNIYKQVKDPNLVGALSGHKEGSKAFARYREIDDEIKTELVKLLE